MTDKHSLPTQRRNFTPYHMIWALLASLSVAYLGLLFTQPRSVASFMGGGPAVSEEEMRGVLAAASEVPYLRESMSQARMDLDEIKAELQGRNARDRELSERVAALETRQQEAAKAAEPAPASAAKPAEKRAERQPAKPSGRLGQETKDSQPALPAIAAAEEPKAPAAAGPQKPAKKTAKAPRDDGDEIGVGLETGSVAGDQPPVTFGPPVVTPANSVPSKTYGLQVGRGPSVESLRIIWSSLSSAHSDSLGSLQPRYVAGTDPLSSDYDLVAGPVASAGEAKRICKELTQKGTACTVSDYTGNAF